MISFNIETLNYCENLPLQTLFIKFDVAIATFKNLLNMAVLEERKWLQLDSNPQPLGS